MDALQTIEVPEAVYSIRDGIRRRDGYQVEISPRLARYIDGNIAEVRMSDTALEILCRNGNDFSIPTASLLIHLFKEGKDSTFFDDTFGRNPEGKSYFECTSTRLRTPRRWENGRQDTDETYPREVREYNFLKGGWYTAGFQKVLGGKGLFGILAVNPVTGVALQERAGPEDEPIIYWGFNPDQYETDVFLGCYRERDKDFMMHPEALGDIAPSGKPPLKAEHFLLYAGFTSPSSNTGFRKIRGVSPREFTPPVERIEHPDHAFCNFSF